MFHQGKKARCGSFSSTGGKKVMKFRVCESRFPLGLVFFVFLILTVAFSVTGGAKNSSSASREQSPESPRNRGSVLVAAAKAPAKASKAFEWKKLGEQVYANTCLGVPNTFPPLKGNAVVLAKDPKDHIQSILKGVQGKKIGGVSYATPMPPQANLSDAEIAAVVNHERTSWGNNAPTVTPEDVKKLRGQ